MFDSRIRGLSHLAIAVKSFSNIEKWTKLFPEQNISEYSSQQQGVNARVIHLGDFDLEFLEPIDENSTISSFLERNPRGGIHHVCFFVDNVEESLGVLKKEGVRSIGLQKATGLIHGLPVAFLNPLDLSGVLVEFEEAPGPKP